MAALEALIDPDTRGDPESPPRWTCKSTRILARALTENGYQVSDFVVRRLLKELGYSLQANAKTTQAASIPTATPSSSICTSGPRTTWCRGIR